MEHVLHEFNKIQLNFEDDKKHNASKFMSVCDPIKHELNVIHLALKESIL